MPTITELFPAPTLDPTRWVSTLQGSTSLTIGAPSDGVYPVGVDDPGDQVTVDSKNRLTVPAGSFDARIFYDDVFDDIDENISSFLGWRSNQVDGGGMPAFGIDILLCVKPGPVFELQKQTVNLGSVNRGTVINDPLNGGNGGFRVTRSASTYSLYFFNAGWVLLAQEVLPFSGPGFIFFGQLAESPTLQAFPWVPQT